MEEQIDLSHFDISKVFRDEKSKKSYEPAIPKEIGALIPVAFLIQEKLKAIDVNSLVAGGLAIELLAHNSLPNHTCRKHKDIDLLISRNQLHSIDDVMKELGLKQISEETHRFNTPTVSSNLRTFENEEGIRIDIMGYHTTSRKDIGDFPLMSWGEIDRHRIPIEINLKPVEVEYEERRFDVLSPESLLKMKLAQKTKFDKDDTGKKDLELLRRIVEKVV